MLVEQHQSSAEERLSGILLNIAASYRALDDQLSDDDQFSAFKNQRFELHETFVTVNEGTRIPDPLRECCNKIIHTDDFRPSYENGSQPREEGVWYMTGEIELMGRRGNAPWKVTFDMFKFLEAMLEVTSFLASDPDAGEQSTAAEDAGTN